MEGQQNCPRWQKSCWMFFLCLTAAGTSFAQGSPESFVPPNLEIIKLKWEKEVRLPRNFDPTDVPSNGTFTDPAAMTSGPATAGTMASTGGSGASDPIVSFPRTPSQLPVFYVYSLKIRNAGAKTIVGIAWDYLFIEPNINAEVGRHQFLSYTKVPPNKSGKLQGQLRTPPTRVIGILDSGKNTHSKLNEKGVIQCVLYADDTVWRNPYGRKGVCEFLKSERVLIQRKHAPAQP